jgi:ketosteroid isomerase-like protein
MATATLQNPVTTDKAAILAVAERIRQAHHDKDAEAIVAEHALDAHLFSLAPPLMHRPDVEETQKWLNTWRGPVEFSYHHLQIKVSGNLAVASGYVRLAGRKIGAAQPVDFWFRGTLTLERRHGDWQIVHEHHSVPFYMDGSLRPAFDLQPKA